MIAGAQQLGSTCYQQWGASFRLCRNTVLCSTAVLWCSRLYRVLTDWLPCVAELPANLLTGWCRQLQCEEPIDPAQRNLQGIERCTVPVVLS